MDNSVLKKNRTIRINLWSGPRNISTALMYSFAQRKDMTVYDEPLYAHYLSKTPAKNYHPGAEEILQTMENNGNKVVEMILGAHPTPIAFFKHMTHHLVSLDWSFMKESINIILTRDPVEMLPSYINQVAEPQLHDVGYKIHLEVVDYLKGINQPIIVLDSKEVLLNPKKVLEELCSKINIPFYESMLSWPKGARREDGVWAKRWYHNVHQSTGFAKYTPKTAAFPEQLKPLLEICKPYYNELHAIAIKA